jgi:DNA-binding NarL/FixJ family response regulator
LHRILVLVVSENHTEARVLRNVLREQSGGWISVVGVAGRGDEALSRSLALRPNVILVNFSRAEEGHLEIVPRVRGQVLEAGIVAITPPESTFAEMARAAGADAVVARTNVAADLVPAIRRAAQAADWRRQLTDQYAAEEEP